MPKKRFLMVILLIILIVGIIIIALNFDRFGKPEVLSKPVFDNPEVEICELSSIPSITLKSNNGDCEIYYTLDGDNPNAEFLKYDKPILLEEPNQDERIIEFTLKAFARKKGCKDSPFLVQRFSFDFPTNDSGGDAISCGEPKIGDTVVEGSITEDNITKQIRKKAVLKITRNKKKIEYNADIVNGKFKIIMDKPFEKGDKLWIYASCEDKVINSWFDKDNNLIRIWEDYYSFYGGDFGRTL